MLRPEGIGVFALTGTGVNRNHGAKKWIYVAGARAADTGVPDDTNRILHESLQGAKAAPLAKIQSAIDLATGHDGVVIVVQPGRYEGTVSINAKQSGTRERPNYLISETYHGAEIIGETSGDEASALLIMGGRNWRFHNLVLTNRYRGHDNSACKIVHASPPRGADLPDTNIIVAGCKHQGKVRNLQKFANLRNMKVVGCHFSPGPDGDVKGSKAIGWNTVIGGEFMWNKIDGDVGGGFGPKAHTNGVLIESNDIMTNSDTQDSQALLLGNHGYSRANREWPFGGSDAAPWAEAAQITVRNNKLISTHSSAIHCRGTDYITIEGNWCQAGKNMSAYIEMVEAYARFWQNQPREAPAEHAAFMTPFGPHPAELTYFPRRLTVLSGWVASGSARLVNENGFHSETNFITDPAFSPGPDAVLIGAIGPAGWDETAIYRQLGFTEG